MRNSISTSMYLSLTSMIMDITNLHICICRLIIHITGSQIMAERLLSRESTNKT